VSVVICAADNADYSFDSVSLAGPVSIPDGGSASFTATWTATVHAPGGSVCPLGELLDEDGVLRFDADRLDHFEPVLGTTATAGPRTGSAAFSLRCENGQVVGASGGSSEGSRPAFFLPVDEAEVFAVITRTDGSAEVRSNVIDVTCR
jgi:hypothetical protein